MTALSRIFFRHEMVPSRAGAVIDWWESRRGVYNIGVGAAGLFTLAVVNIFAALPPMGSPLGLIPNVGLTVIYGTMANVCYTGGWLAELGLRRWMPYESDTVGAALFRYGFAFSVGLTLFPAALMVLHWIGRSIATLLGWRKALPPRTQ